MGEWWNLAIPRGEYLRAALLVSLLSVWMLVGLFYYLNRYTKRDYFSIWTAAWLFYALWLTLCLNEASLQSGTPADASAHMAAPNSKIFLLSQCCVAISAAFLMWGSLRFLGLKVSQKLFGLFMAFLVVWTFVSPQVTWSANPAQVRFQIQFPVFILLGLGSIFAGACFYRLRKKMPFVGAGLLSIGFFLWGLYLGSYPFAQLNSDLNGFGFLLAAVLQLFIAVSMIVLVLEEVRYNAEQVRAEIAAVRSEKDALQMKVITAEEQCRSLYDQVRLTQGVQEAYDALRRTQQVVVQQERLRALGQMASGVAHDVNNALSPIVAYSDLLLTTLPDLPESARNYLKTINQSGEDIAHIVARMREFYRRRSDNEPLTEVSMDQLIKEVTELTRPRWRDVSQRDGVSIQIRSELEPNLPKLWTEPTDLREALINLVFNAVDALPKGGVITLAARGANRSASHGIPQGVPERLLILEVRDNGVGMDESVRQRCLEPFFSTKTQHGGTGLGLAMVYGMMQRHDGSIQIESAPDRGTTVRLTFPIRDKPAAAAIDVPQMGQSRPLNVLCIDDEAKILELLNVCLGHFHHRVTLASSAQQGLEFFRAALKKNQRYQAVITDLGMPEIDGGQLARTIKAEAPDTPVVMMTGWGTMMKESGEKPPGVDALVSKPPRMHELNDLLQRLTLLKAGG